MKRLVLFSGIGILIAGVLMTYVSGISGGTQENPVPSYPALYALQTYFTLLIFIGVAGIVVGIILKDKKRK